MPTDQHKGGYWLTPEDIPLNESAVKRLQLVELHPDPRYPNDRSKDISRAWGHEPEWQVEFETVEMEREIYSPFGYNRHVDKLEPLADNHPEANPGGRSGGAVQFRSKVGGRITKLTNRATGQTYEGDALYDFVVSRLAGP